MKKRIIIISCALLLCVVAAAIAITLSHKSSSNSNRQQSTATQKAVTDGTSSDTGNNGSDGSISNNSSSSNTGQASSSNPTSKQSTTNGNSPNAVLAAPSGNFVSNHHPSLSQNGMSSEESVCNVPQGISCTISFSKDGVTKSLASKVADATGSVYWSWNLQTVGVTAGSWQITAIAAKDGQSKTANDSLALTVSP